MRSIISVKRISKIGIVLAAGLCLAGGAWAADGVTDFVVDPAATYVIGQPGSYRLSSNATMTADLGAIQITANNVTLDLNGHTITGIGSGTAVGIDIQGITTTITNGTVDDFGGTGISAYGPIRVENVIVQHNGGSGMRLGEDAEILNCKALYNLDGAPSNTDAGINVVQMCRIIGCEVRGNNPPANSPDQNSAYGIRATARTIIENCIATEQVGAADGDGIGISTGAGCIIRGNLCTNNSPGIGVGYGVGIDISSAALVENNVCTGNGIVGDAGNGIGIDAGLNSTVRGNQVTATFAFQSGTEAIGIRAGQKCRIDGNKIEGFPTVAGVQNIGIQLLSDGNLLLGNMIDGTATYGIRFSNVSGTNRAESNRLTNAGPISQNAGGTLSQPTAGDARENLAY